MKTINLIVLACIITVMEILYRGIYYASPIVKQDLALATVNGNAVTAGWSRAFSDGEAAARPIMLIFYILLMIFFLVRSNTTKNKNEK